MTTGGSKSADAFLFASLTALSASWPSEGRALFRAAASSVRRKSACSLKSHLAFLAAVWEVRGLNLCLPHQAQYSEELLLCGWLSTIRLYGDTVPARRLVVVQHSQACLQFFLRNLSVVVVVSCYRCIHSTRDIGAREFPSCRGTPARHPVAASTR